MSEDLKPQRMIYKYQITDSLNEIVMPKGAHVLSFQYRAQDQMFVLWALIDPTVQLETRKFHMVMTGEQFDHQPNYKYIETTQAGPIVAHLFEVQ